MRFFGTYFLLVFWMMPFSWGASIEARLQSLPTAVSGTLSPFVLAIDGVVVHQESEEATDLILDGKFLNLETSPTRPFYFKSTADGYLFTVKKPDAKLGNVSVVLPRIVRVTLGEGTSREIHLTFEETTDLVLDGKTILIDEGSATLSPLLGASWEDSMHTLELNNKSSGLSRIYNLEILPKPKSPRQSVAVGVGGDGMRPAPAYYLGYQRAYDTRWSWIAYSVFGGQSGRQFVSLGVRGGRQLLRKWHRKGYGSWLEAGAFFRMGLENWSGYYFLGTSENKVGLQSGVYSRTELLEFKNFTFGLHFQYSVLDTTTLSSVGESMRMGAWLEMGYFW